MLALVAGVAVGTLAVVYAIRGNRGPSRPYPAGPGAPIDDGLPGAANIVPWGGEDPVVDEAESAAHDFKRLVDAGALKLVEGAADCLREFSRPVAIGLIMEALEPIVAPAARGSFARWYDAMALVYYIDDRIVDRDALRAYHATLPVLALADPTLLAVLTELGHAPRLAPFASE